MGTVGERVRKEREAQRMSRQELSRRTGIGYSTIAELERGGMQTSTRLHDIAKALGVSVTWLATGKGPKHEPATNFDAEWRDIPADPTGVSAGGGRVPDDYAETHKLKFRASSLRKKGLFSAANDRLRVEYVVGDSMLPRLRDGDAILVDTHDNKQIVDGKIYWIRHNGEWFVKVLHKAGDTIIVESMNKLDPAWRTPRVVRPGEDFEVVGRVRWLGSWED